MPTNNETEPGGGLEATSQPMSRGASNRSNSSLQLPGGDLSAPPSPARVKGQRASMAVRGARGTSQQPDSRSSTPPTVQVSERARARVREMEERQREAETRLPGEEKDEFGLPLRPMRRSYMAESDKDSNEDEGSDKEKEGKSEEGEKEQGAEAKKNQEKETETLHTPEKSKDKARDKGKKQKAMEQEKTDGEDSDAFQSAEESPEDLQRHENKKKPQTKPQQPLQQPKGKENQSDPKKEQQTLDEKSKAAENKATAQVKPENTNERPKTPEQKAPEAPEQTPEQRRQEQKDRMGQIFETTLQNDAIGGVSAVSHQALAIKANQEAQAPPKSPEEDEWQDMRAYGKFDVYNDDGRVVAKGFDSDSEDDEFGARKGYTKLNLDEDAQSQTSMDENTSYLFKERNANLFEEDDETRDPLQQMQATKDMLTDGQRIAYVGLTRLSVAKMVKDMDHPEVPKKLKKDFTTAVDAARMWGQKMMVRLYAHMEIESSEQIMIEQLTEHGVQPGDLTPLLMQNARVKNPMAGKGSPKSSSSVKSPTSAKSPTSLKSPTSMTSPTSIKSLKSMAQASEAERKAGNGKDAEQDGSVPPPYAETDSHELTVQSPSMLPTTQSIDIDLRWTVLCDLFLVLIADSIYDSRSRRLLEIVGDALQVTWMDICRFEKRVTDALEMEEEAARENWDEKDNVETRRKAALKRRYVYMGLATVGGTLVIGLSAGLLAPVIGAGLGAGLSAIGVAGTTSFMAGAGGAAIITTASGAAGGIIAVRASSRRTGAVKTFEYRPLHNNKRVNLIVTISGWMNGKVDDVRLPFSTVDPVMGDIYSLLWEPDVLQSTGDTIRILATEALTQGLQHVLAATFLTTLMAGLSLPIILSKLSYLIDNPWSVSLDRADAAGLILADSLIERNLGVRPITLVGFSLGARVIFSALRELANKGAYGLIQNVYLFGSPIVAKKEEYMRAQTVVSGRFVNGYATNDWIIGYLFRATSGGISRVAGLKAVEGIPGVENLDVTSLVNGHMAYRTAMPKLLREVGWEVESDEFAEIEDPDPENHEARQRELIKEIDNARQQAEKEEPKSRWGAFWQRKREKKGAWETYDVNSAYAAEKEKRGITDPNASILFDLEAIRRELESEQLEVKEIQSTLPPMRLDLEQKAANGAEEPKVASPKVTSPVKSPKVKSPKLGSDKWEEYDEVADGAGPEVTMSFENPKTPTWGKQADVKGEPTREISRDPSRDPSRRASPDASREVSRSRGDSPHEGGSGWQKERHTTKPDAPIDMGHNAWADDEAQEGEMKMTFE